MSLTVSDQAASYYTMYAFKNSEPYQKNAVDETKVSEDSYHIASLTNALNAMDKTASSDIFTFEDVADCAKDAYETSQLPAYTILDETSESGMLNLLTNTSDQKDLLRLSSTYSMSGTEYLESLALAGVSNTGISGNVDSYLDGSSEENVLNELA